MKHLDTCICDGEGYLDCSSCRGTGEGVAGGRCPDCKGRGYHRCTVGEPEPEDLIDFDYDE